MEKQLRQFAPFLALIVAAALVVIANPAETNSGGDEDAEVAGIASSRSTSTTGVPAAAVDVPSDGVAPADATPFAPVDSGSSSTPSFSTSGSSSSSSFDSTPSFSSSATTPAAPTTTVSFDTPTTTAATIPVESTTTTIAGETPGVSDFFLFSALGSSAACSAGGDAEKPLSLVDSYQQAKLVSEPNFPDRAGGIALNKADPDPERFIYRTHSLISTSSVSVTDTANNNATRILSQRTDWERFDGIAWSPNRTLLVGENVRVAEKPDPVATTAKAGLVYEIDAYTGAATVRPALGSKAHRGMAFDHLGNVYSVSATNPGYVYRFVPSSPNNYGSGTLSALWVGSNGESVWLALDADAVKVDADAAAAAAGATAFLSPEDAETLTVTAPNGTKRSQLFIAEQGANRVLTVVLRGADNTAYTATYVAPGVNAPSDFTAPSDLIIDTPYNLYIAERNGGGSETSKSAGDDIWVAPANSTSAVRSLPAGRMASVTDCDGEPAGLMFDGPSSKLYLNIKDRGGDGRDMTLLITRSGGN